MKELNKYKLHFYDKYNIGCQILTKDKAETLNIKDKEALELGNICKLYKEKRLNYIDKCLDIENELNTVIKYFFIKDNTKAEFDLFDEYVLKAEFFSFIQKKKVFERILEQIKDD